MDSDNDHPLDRDLDQMRQDSGTVSRKIPTIIESASNGMDRRN